MKRLLLALAVATSAAFGGLGSIASAATLSYGYKFDSFTSMTLHMVGSQAGNIFTIDNLRADFTSTGGTLGVTSFGFNSLDGGYHLSGAMDHAPGSFNTATNFFDLALITLPIDNACNMAPGFCLIGGSAWVHSPGNLALFTAYNPGNLTRIAAVPLPASLPLLAAGLGVMGVFRLRKRRAA